MVTKYMIALDAPHDARIISCPTAGDKKHGTDILVLKDIEDRSYVFRLATIVERWPDEW